MAQTDELIEVALKTSALLEQMERSSEQVTKRGEQWLHQARQSLEQVRSEMTRQLADTRQDIAGGAHQAVREALDKDIGALRQQMKQAVDEFRQEAHTQRDERLMLAKMTRILGWKVAGLSLLTFALLFAGGMFWLWQTNQRIERATVNAEVQEALQQVQITSCGGKPCIRLDDKTPRWGKQGEYVLIGLPTAQPAK